ncbi:MAG: hypothetical protein WCL02_02605 [bacterium]
MIHDEIYQVDTSGIQVLPESVMSSKNEVEVFPHPSLACIYTVLFPFPAGSIHPYVVEKDTQVLHVDQLFANLSSTGVQFSVGVVIFNVTFCEVV